MEDATIDKNAIRWKQALDGTFQNNYDIKFIGVYSVDSADPLAVAGMSNFNLDEKSRSDADQIMFDIANIRYSRQASFEAKHMLTISAILHEDALLIGIAISSETSCILTVLQEIVAYKKNGAAPKKNLTKPASKPLVVVKKSNKGAMDNNPTEVSDVHVTSNDQSVTAEQHDTTPTKPKESFELQEIGVADVKRRASTKAELERRKDSTRRETEFCEDWRTATIRSIEALRNIGPFEAGMPFDDDQKPLIPTESGLSTESEQGSVRRTSRPTMV